MPERRGWVNIYTYVCKGTETYLHGVTNPSLLVKTYKNGSATLKNMITPLRILGDSLVDFMFKSRVAENPELGSFPTGYIMRVRLPQGPVTMKTLAGRASQEEGIRLLQRHEKRQERKG